MHKHRKGRYRPLPELHRYTIHELPSGVEHDVIGTNLEDAIEKFAGPALGYVHLGVPIYVRQGRQWYAAYRGEKTDSVERIY
tara:strand:+ start:267 stop:512 length:246 start_codon:yes stop_codon:yes gene_type:complete